MLEQAANSHKSLQKKCQMSKQAKANASIAMFLQGAFLVKEHILDVPRVPADNESS